jgi:DNA mismatch endonuclease (patch repair protein)
MVDIVDKATRSRMMSGIRGKNTSPELIIRRLLHAHGLRYRLHVKDLPGKPDIVLPRHKAVVMVHGCFWHGHCCSLFRWPSTRSEFWQEKIERNRTNDAKTMKLLMMKGWRVGIVWECAIRGKNRDVEVVVKTLVNWINSDTSHFEAKG